MDKRIFTTYVAQDKIAPPEWALLERLIIQAMNEAGIEFVNRYTRSDRTLIWRDRWPGMDGSDDPYEAFMNFPLLYIIGGNDKLNELSREMWESITWQWTQYGQIHNEYDAYYDWMHHGESNIFFYFIGLAQPYLLKFRQRALKFAAMYIGEDEEAQNYDKEHRLIRSPINGSRGPKFHQTAEDWETHREILDNYLPPFEDIPGVNGNGSECPWSNDETYKEILKRINERQARGDVPLNLVSTSLITHAYLYTQDEKYKDWVTQYLNTWILRTKENNGITPDNVGLNGIIGEYNDGKWWGGYYGWRWPHGTFTILEPEVIAGCNAVLLTGDMSYLDLARSQLDMLWSLRKYENGQWLVPNRHYDDGWRDYRIPHPMYAVYLWNISMSEEDAERAERGLSENMFSELDNRLKSYGQKTNGGHMGYNGNTVQWFRFIRGKDPEYPIKILKSNFLTILEQLQKIRSNEFDPALMDHYKEVANIHQWQELMPIVIEGLAQLTLGGPMHVYHGGLQHARLRYYDAILNRPGLPEDVAALVEKLTDTSATVRLVNIGLCQEREVIIQAGMFGEHRFISADVLNDEEEVVVTIPLDDKLFCVKLPIGTGVRFRLIMERYVNVPTYESAWGTEDKTFQIYGRKEYDL